MYLDNLEYYESDYYIYMTFYLFYFFRKFLLTWAPKIMNQYVFLLFMAWDDGTRFCIIF